MSFVAVPQISNGVIFLKGTKIASRPFARFAAGSGALLCALGFAGGAHGASYTLSIDLSDPSAVTMVASAGNAFNSSLSGLKFSEGITLGFFLNGNTLPPFQVGGVAAASTLTSVGSPALMFDRAFSTTVDGQNGAGQPFHLNLSNASGSGTALSFTAGSQVLTGTAVFNLSSLQAYFPDATVGAPAHGNIYAGVGWLGPQIGDWTAVPEVSTNAQMAVVGLGCAGFLVQRARRAKL